MIRFQLPSIPISLVIVVANAPLLVILYSFVSYYSIQYLDLDQDIIKGFIEWFGTVYSLFITLVLITVSARYETVEREFDQELDAVVTLYQSVKYARVPVDAKTKRTPDEFENIVGNIKNYISHVITNHKTEHNESDVARSGRDYLREIGKDISGLTLYSRKYHISESIFNQLFRSLNEALDVRGDRISHTKQHTPGIVRLIAFVASAIWLLAFFTLKINDNLLSVIIIGGIAFIIVMVLGIIDDLSNPFDGSWKINIDDWVDFKNVLDE